MDKDDKAEPTLLPEPRLLGSPFMRSSIIRVAAVNWGMYGGRVGAKAGRLAWAPVLEELDAAGTGVVISFDSGDCGAIGDFFAGPIVQIEFWDNVLDSGCPPKNAIHPRSRKAGRSHDNGFFEEESPTWRHSVACRVN